MMAASHNWLVHGVTWRSAPLPAGAPAHRRISFGELVFLTSVESTPAAGCSTHTDCAAFSKQSWQQAEVADGLRHSRLLSAYVTEAAVVPFYFGGTLSSCQRLTQQLRENAAAFSTMLRRVEGCAEYVVQSKAMREGREPLALFPHREASACVQLETVDKSGGDDVSTAAIATTLQSFVGAQVPFVNEMQQLASGSSGSENHLHLSMLVPHKYAPQFLSISKSYDCQLAARGLGLDVTGPLPPYSFTYPNTIRPVHDLARDGRA